MKLFAFPGYYVVFAPMGPIFEDFDMLRHRSELLMTSTPMYDSIERNLMGHVNVGKVLSDSKRHRKNSEDDKGDNTSSKLRRNTIDHEGQKPAAAPTLSECIQPAGIADRGKINPRSTIALWPYP